MVPLPTLYTCSAFNAQNKIKDRIKLEIKSKTKNERLKTKMPKLKIIKKKIKDKPPQDVGGP